MGSKLPQLSLPLLKSLLSPSTTPTSLLSSLQSLEPRASITTVDSSTSEILSNYYSLYLLTLILVDDLTEARALTNRIDTQLLHNDAAIISSYRVLQAVWSKDYVAFHQTMQGAPWGEITAVLAGRVLQKHRTTTLSLLSTAYTSIPPELAQKYLGVSDEQRTVKMLVEENPEFGWSLNDQGFLVRNESGGINTVKQEGRAKEGEIGRLAGLGGFLSDV
ncbi:hypothetical protein TWF106_008486 [Orbilia oligospora]|uniref:CSN8/PSMD8/EIF3K domain-containing protein n=1 Tax=Orbilia oligospora TaxID=2813651 RepID=A0A6G1MHY8_ORBOL|nr:hypothetical protein TWF788_004246 [Orbilia oligospora]KAF3216311.1 hypothetical protein TWF106_008486 [Orbilia oligospora]KAF3220326.1 hypothetical protein TWF679_009701 [Orbilia oligospora]KAF3227467.1 hypothetical protein TWF191_003552 [Orbilia oligospora]KAF3258986.1 hypothetical protein TWF192_011119 [Orbilia oligospora]